MQHVFGYFDTHVESYLCIYRGDLSLFADLFSALHRLPKVLRRVSLVKVFFRSLQCVILVMIFYLLSDGCKVGMAL